MHRGCKPIFHVVCILFAATIGAMWVRSYWVADMFAWDHSERTTPGLRVQRSIRSVRGEIDVGQLNYVFGDARWRVQKWFSSRFYDHVYDAQSVTEVSEALPSNDGAPLLNRLGFRNEDIVAPPMFDMGEVNSADGWYFSIPYWFVFSTTMGVLCVLAYAVNRRRFRKRKGGRFDVSVL